LALHRALFDDLASRCLLANAIACHKHAVMKTPPKTECVCSNKIANAQSLLKSYNLFLLTPPNLTPHSLLTNSNYSTYHLPPRPTHQLYCIYLYIYYLKYISCCKSGVSGRIAETPLLQQIKKCSGGGISGGWRGLFYVYVTAYVISTFSAQGRFYLLYGFFSLVKPKQIVNACVVIF